MSLIHDACLMKIMYAAVHEIRSYIRFLGILLLFFPVLCFCIFQASEILSGIFVSRDIFCNSCFFLFFKADDFYLSAAFFLPFRFCQYIFHIGSSRQLLLSLMSVFFVFRLVNELIDFSHSLTLFLFSSCRLSG